MAERALGALKESVEVKSSDRDLAWVLASTAALVIVDLIISVASFISSYKLRHGAQVFSWSDGALPVGLSAGFEPYVSVLVFAPTVKIWALRRFGLYRLRGEFSFSGDIVNVFKATTLAFLVLVLIAFLFRQGISVRDDKIALLDFSYSRLVFLADWLISLCAFWLVRVAVRIFQIILRNRGHNLIAAVVVGCGQMARVCVSEMSRRPTLGYRLIGVVAAHQREDASALKGEARLLGHFDDLPELVKRFGIEEVLITDTRISPRRMFEILMECGRDHHIKYRVVPNLFDCMPGKTEVATIGALPMIKLYEEPLRGPQRAIKRSMDVAVSILIVLLTWPLWVVLAALIKLESRGPVFLRQERVGMDGKMFLMLKFRSMKEGADDTIHRELMRRMINGEDVNQGTPDRPLYGKVKDDPRLTRIGSWMRRYSLDELPQVINVLKGEMSIVGPRPPLPYEVKHYKDWHRARFHVKPGITGLWQVSGRNRLHFEDMVRLDIFYIENWSPWLDLKIIFKTIPVVLRGEGE
jgi:exopolysaccharide biosynthesis polyprenyl glycosylphosphotransferase